MRIYSYTSHRTLILIVICLFLTGYTASQAITADSQRHHVARGSTFVQPTKGAARLIVWRAPYLGNFLIIHLSIDGEPPAAIGYGRTYEAFLSPGRHVLSLLPTPNPKWRLPWQLVLDARSGQTYAFTARGDSGYLVLTPPGGPEAPRGR
jgi:hypothetical protein